MRSGARPQVLFVGHEASRTGAPLMFLYFLRWVRANTDLVFEVVLLEGGPLVEDFRALAPVRVLSDLQRGRLSRLLKRARLDRQAAMVRSVHARRWCSHLRSVSTVYCNSVSSLRVLRLLGTKPPLVISHVHELEGALSMPGTEADRHLLQTRPDRIVAASDLVKANLVDNHDIDAARVVRHYEFIEVEPFLAQAASGSAEQLDIRAHLGIPADAAVVGAVGVTESRKGPDLFLLLAMLLRRRDLGREVHFVWVGANPDTHETRWIKHDIARSGLADVVHLVGPQARPAPWFEQFDVFALTSREDPFPLVCLESSLLGTPIVCFDNTGMAEFAGDGECGFVVPYLDVAAMADKVETLLGDSVLRGVVGDRAGARVRSFHDVSYGAPALYADLQAWRHPGGEAGGEAGG